MIASDDHRPLEKRALVSVVLPLYNEAAAVERLYAELAAACGDFPAEAEFLFVNDGSQDGSGRLLDRLAVRDPRVRVLHLSRNFGHQAAVHAGLLHGAATPWL